MNRAPLSVSFALVCLAGFASNALADGKRDLDDGIAFYENLDTDRAIERLESAVAAPDLSDADRAKAYLYLGMLRIENGEVPAADLAWQRCFSLMPEIAAPSGTSPKTIEALEAARTKAKASPVEIPKPEPEPELPKVEEKPPEEPPVIVFPEEPEEGEGTNWLLWGGIGAGAVAVAVVVVALAAGGSGSECQGDGGCALVSFQ